MVYQFQNQNSSSPDNKSAGQSRNDITGPRFSKLAAQKRSLSRFTKIAAHTMVIISGCQVSSKNLSHNSEVAKSPALDC
ncbi:hypothetical protein DPMN_182138 [Dreissena polymorpha]|uniref:Uncharacterized protein n=1 Tax=Dreissena polymorpha TaxID=45954 RepID=A0A9D4DHI9_DREPO|nr:hypothetical protein DPMN_182138 [Dreissena polymorpha]